MLWFAMLMTGLVCIKQFLDWRHDFDVARDLALVAIYFIYSILLAIVALAAWWLLLVHTTMSIYLRSKKYQEQILDD
jgi:hypothetical protein